MTRALCALLAICLCLGQGGCALTFTTTLPDNPTQLRYFDCTSTPGLAVADAVFAVSNGVSAAMTFSQSEEEYADENDGGNRNVVGGISVALAALSLASGIYGIVHSERCRHAKAELRDRLLAPERETKDLSPTATPSTAPPPATPAAPPAAVQPPPTPAPEPPPAAAPTSSGGLIAPAPPTPPPTSP
jgi:hypothetical protein